MPTAIKFECDLLDNGFGFIPFDAEISGFAYWTTLGGINADNIGSMSSAEKEEKKLLSFKHAMKLRWNLYSLSMYARSTSYHSAFTPPDSELIRTSVEYDDPEFPDSDLAEPKKRTCVRELSLFIDDDFYIYSETGGRLINRILKMTYNGEFVGYGINRNTDGGFPFGGFAGTGQTPSVSLGSYSTISGGSGNIADVAYKEVSGMHFVCKAVADDASGAGYRGSSVDAENMTASEYWGDPAVASRWFDGEITLDPDPLTFYTYPT